MSDATMVIGRVGWVDLTVSDATRVRDFYAHVVGWTPTPLDMGGYHDFSMKDAAGADAAGICHRRGPNASMPSGWIPYFTVADLKASLEQIREQGGEVLSPADASVVYFRDPSGAVAALMGTKLE